MLKKVLKLEKILYFIISHVCIDMESNILYNKLTIANILLTQIELKQTSR